jgi:GNAT superfamily N-acetyltransferase
MGAMNEESMTESGTGSRHTTDDIRRALPEQATLLSELAFRSKGHWGYEDAFLASSRDALAVSPIEVATSLVYASVGAEGDITGFYRLLPHDGDVAELDSLFVEPAAIGHGVGRRLWEHAVATSRLLGFTALEFQSDPHAEGFYLAMGAKRCGESESTVIPGRMLPLMRFSLR